MVCNHGYEPKDVTKNNMYLCNPFDEIPATGHWHLVNSDQPECVKVVCPDQEPPYVLHGEYYNYTTDNKFYFNDNVTYKCNTGYVIANTDTPSAICTISNSGDWTWADVEPECVCK